MTWTDPDSHAYSVGEILGSGTLNQFVKENLKYLHNADAAEAATRAADDASEAAARSAADSSEASTRAAADAAEASSRAAADADLESRLTFAIGPWVGALPANLSGSPYGRWVQESSPGGPPGFGASLCVMPRSGSIRAVSGGLDTGITGSWDIDILKNGSPMSGAGVGSSTQTLYGTYAAGAHTFAAGDSIQPAVTTDSNFNVGAGGIDINSEVWIWVEFD